MMMAPRILIAEDDPDLQELYSRFLADRFEILAAANGQEAIDRFLKERPALVLMDLRMPVLSGDEAISRIREHDPTARIIAITAFRHTPDELRVPVLRKPFEPEQLFAAIEAELTRRPEGT